MRKGVAPVPTSQVAARVIEGPDEERATAILSGKVRPGACGGYWAKIWFQGL